jgi:hypothetical protein
MKSRFEGRKSEAGYRSPAERDSCRNCRHRSEGLHFDNRASIAYDCTRGHFLVSPGGICRHYQKNQQTTEANHGS